MSILKDTQELISRATLKIHTERRGDGQCVVVEDGMIITAAHCVDWNNDGGMTQGNHFLSKISTEAGNVTGSVAAVEPVSDVAILECPDPQTFYNESVAFDDYCDVVVPVKLALTVPKTFQAFPVWVLTHLKTWVFGTATFNGVNSTFGYMTNVKIANGTSGGPIVNESGGLVGIVSQGTNTGENGKFTSSAALLPLALPAWVIERVKNHRNTF